jgi:glycosyltransferase involved in cell wall biosynthesis
VLPVCQLSKTPLVVHFHGYDAYMHDVVAANRSGYHRLFESASAVIAVSQHMRRHLIGLGAPSDKVVFNPYGIELEDFKGARPDRNPPIFLAVGRFVDKKGPQFTIRAFSKTASAVPGSQLIMVGDGPLLGSCSELVSRLGLDANVSLVGSRPHADVARLMAGSRCFVQHSVTPASGDMEGTPLAILEAMASGLPVVATRHGGILDVVREGISGFLVDERDVETMADAMLAIASDLKTAAAFGVAGRDIVMRNYSMEVSIGQLTAVLDEAILKPPPFQ